MDVRESRQQALPDALYTFSADKSAMIRRVHRERCGKCIGVVSIRPVDVPPNWIERTAGHPDTSLSISELRCRAHLSAGRTDLTTVRLSASCCRQYGRSRCARPPVLLIHSANTPFWTRPSCANALVVPDGFDTNRKPRLLEADHVIVALVRLSSPVEPGVSTGLVSVTGPIHWMSKLQLASADTGSSNRNRALGMSK